jgi:hypothetical protein
MGDELSLILIATLAFQIWMVIDCIKNRQKFFWIAMILLFPPFGAASYLFFVKLANNNEKPKLKGKDTEEVESLKTLAEQHGKAYHYNELGDIHRKRGELKQAKEYYENAVAKDKDMLSAQYGLAKCLHGLGKYLEAAYVLEDLVAKDRKYDYGNALFGLAESYRMAKNDDKAIKVYEDLFKAYSSFRGYYEYAMLLVKKGRLEDAIASMRTLINNAGSLPDYKYQQEKIWIDKAHKFLSRYQKNLDPL